MLADRRCRRQVRNKALDVDSIVARRTLIKNDHEAMVVSRFVYTQPKECPIYTVVFMVIDRMITHNETN